MRTDPPLRYHFARESVAGPDDLLNYAVISDDEHNSDVIDAIEPVRRIVGDLRVAYLGRSAVSVDADPEYRAAYFRFPHSADARVCVEVLHGDGYSYLKSPIGEYHGSVDDHEFATSSSRSSREG